MARYNTEPERPRMTIAQAAAWVNPVSGEEAEDVKVRKADVIDADVIYGFLKKMRDEQARKRPDIVNREEEMLSVAEIEAAIKDPGKLIFVAENIEGRIVGQILCELEKDDAAEGSGASIAAAADPVPSALEPFEEVPVPAAPSTNKLVIANVFVSDPARRQRIGTALYHEACRAAEELGCTGAELSCWQFDKEAMSFFESLGYKPLLVTMEKKLGG